MIRDSDIAADHSGRAYVREHQRRFPDWVLMYSPHRRSLTAFYKGPCAPGGIVIDAVHPSQLVAKMGAAVQAQWRTRAPLYGSANGARS